MKKDVETPVSLLVRRCADYADVLSVMLAELGVDFDALQIMSRGMSPRHPDSNYNGSSFPLVQLSTGVAKKLLALVHPNGAVVVGILAMVDKSHFRGDVNVEPLEDGSTAVGLVDGSRELLMVVPEVGPMVYFSEDGGSTKRNYLLFESVPMAKAIHAWVEGKCGFVETTP